MAAQKLVIEHVRMNGTFLQCILLGSVPARAWAQAVPILPATNRNENKTHTVGLLIRTAQ